MNAKTETAKIAATVLTQSDKYTDEAIAKVTEDINALRTEMVKHSHHETRVKVWGHILILVIGTAIASAILHDLTGVILGSIPAGGIEIFDRIMKII